MRSYDYGKQEVCGWIRDNFPEDSTIPDVDAGDGKWRYLLREYPRMDAVEAFRLNLQWLRRAAPCLWWTYRNRSGIIHSAFTMGGARFAFSVLAIAG